MPLPESTEWQYVSIFYSIRNINLNVSTWFESSSANTIKTLQTKLLLKL